MHMQVSAVQALTLTAQQYVKLADLWSGVLQAQRHLQADRHSAVSVSKIRKDPSGNPQYPDQVTDH